MDSKFVRRQNISRHFVVNPATVALVAISIPRAPAQIAPHCPRRGNTSARLQDANFFFVCPQCRHFRIIHPCLRPYALVGDRLRRFEYLQMSPNVAMITARDADRNLRLLRAAVCPPLAMTRLAFANVANMQMIGPAEGDGCWTMNALFLG